ncbi:MAG: outer membrane protein assembly factor BamD [Gemmatimonadota bacterium]
MRSATGRRRAIDGPERSTARSGAECGWFRRPEWAVLVVQAAWLIGCSAALPPAEATPTGRFEWSQERFDKRKYPAAIRGFRDFLFREPLHPLADSARYLLGEAYLRSGQELLAANEFSQLAVSRPNSPLADDAQFGTCRAHWELSPKLPLDQEKTRQAIDECTRLLEFFPRSPHTSEARRIRREARAKMAAKQLRNARWYYKRELYESAIIYLELIVSQYPEAPNLPDVLALLYDSYTRVGFRSEAETVRARLLREFPDSEQARKLAGPERAERS